MTQSSWSVMHEGNLLDRASFVTQFGFHYLILNPQREVQIRDSHTIVFHQAEQYR